MIILHRKHPVGGGQFTIQRIAIRPSALDLIIETAPDAPATIEVSGDRYDVVETFEQITGLIGCWKHSDILIRGHALAKGESLQDFHLAGIEYEPGAAEKHEEMVLVLNPWTE
ncbi:hypothetical protein CcrC1_gp079 [Caulobacter phage C1]|nr:hypothetical protein CcrC1_gp079 [Caulobacter phage C1]UTU08307.1 hypothetical protein CcrC2_gp079 [Caulobacter phage C2]UTU08828.1 hypothetical protein CcrJ4_gp077 [Caulobacter phage J4]UTU09381.1 hypothetical protein CcrBL47_gp095 [Caulobacter phage BL47]UTU09941.1 hypothetical protein CcrRB23_gp079 [Caulobacter phage RB23]WGN96966.1 hypothetical protein [Bertelyvirus sp.]